MTKQTIHIPSGYKPSPLGPIPEDWEVKRLGEVAEMTSGTTPSRANIDFYSNGSIPWVKTTDLNNGILNSTEESVTNKALEKTSLKLLPKGTVLVAMYGGFNQIGRTAMLGMEATINQALSALICNEKIYNAYLLSWLNCRVKEWKHLAASSRKDPNITGKDVARFPIAVPPLPEQHRIVSILELWDTAISKQAQLVEKLTLRKRGLMQQLLTGKKRLKGFEGEWKEVRLGEMAMLVGGGTPTTKNTNYWNGNILWISSSDLKEDDLRISGTRFITEEAIVNSTTQLLPTKSILIVTRVGVGKVAIAEQPTCVSQDFTCLIKYDAETNFLAYYLLQLMKKKKNQSQGTSIKGISVDEISKIRIYLPTKIEQVAIASVLVNADKEIEIQKQKLAAIQTQKKGLMQVLLTGERRIK